TPSIRKLQHVTRREKGHLAKTIYTIPYQYLMRRLQKLFVENLKETMIVTPSKYASDLIAKISDLKSIVIYPPIQHLETYLKVGEKLDDKRKNLVVTMGRISPDKNLDEIIEIAGEAREAKFYILGTIPTKGAEAIKASLKHFRYLQDKVKEKKLNNIIMKINTSLSERLEILRKASIYLHATKNETIGRAVIEAMAAGLTPIVYRDGGPWIDILEGKEGLYGYSYRESGEAFMLINSLIIDKTKKVKEMIWRQRQHIKSKFSLSKVRNKWIKAIARASKRT
ncbi:MAG: glycosyltransferase family 4 protein, partial [Candidatus Nezhaarchaeales archaeon]